MRAHRDELIQKGILLPDLANATSPTNGSSALSTIAGESTFLQYSQLERTKRKGNRFPFCCSLLFTNRLLLLLLTRFLDAAGLAACSNINNRSPTIKSKTCQQTTTTLPRHYQLRSCLQSLTRCGGSALSRSRRRSFFFFLCITIRLEIRRAR